MRNRILAIAAIAGAISAPMAAQAQSEITTGVVRGGSVIIDDDGIAVDRRPAFREYVVRERRPSYAYRGEFRVGTVLPDEDISYYDVPPEYRAPGYRYTILNGHTVLIDPRTRRVVEILD